MNPDTLKSLIDLLRASGISYYKTPELELVLAPVAAKPTPSSQAAEEKEPLPKIWEKLPGNYSHKALGLVKRGA